MKNIKLFVVIPFYNEEKLLEGTLSSLALQSDNNFSLILVNNKSTDDSISVIEHFKQNNPNFLFKVITEEFKGTGAAADTGFRYSIEQGAEFIARTDADCIAHRDWIKNIKKCIIRKDVEFIIGKSEFRKDESFSLFSNRFCLAWGIATAELHGALFRRGKDFKYRFRLVMGHNLVISKDLYLKSGGFPRAPIEKIHDDVHISENIRKIITKNKLKRDRNVRVSVSNRRYLKEGILNTLMWYWGHKYIPKEVDIR